MDASQVAEYEQRAATAEARLAALEAKAAAGGGGTAGLVAQYVSELQALKDVLLAAKAEQEALEKRAAEVRACAVVLVVPMRCRALPLTRPAPPRPAACSSRRRTASCATRPPTSSAPSRSATRNWPVNRELATVSLRHTHTHTSKMEAALPRAASRAAGLTPCEP